MHDAAPALPWHASALCVSRVPFFSQQASSSCAASFTELFQNFTHCMMLEVSSRIGDACAGLRACLRPRHDPRSACPVAAPRALLRPTTQGAWRRPSQRWVNSQGCNPRACQAWRPRVSHTPALCRCRLALQQARPRLPVPAAASNGSVATEQTTLEKVAEVGTMLFPLWVSSRPLYCHPTPPRPACCRCFTLRRLKSEHA